MKVNKVRLSIDAVLFMLMCAALFYTLYNKTPLFSAEAVKVVKAYPQGNVYRGTYSKFVFEFFKLRDECRNPTIKRTLIDLDTGENTGVKDDTNGVVQYPKTTSGGPDKIAVGIKIPEDWRGSSNVIVTDLCYKCPKMPVGDPHHMGIVQEKICRSFSTERFSVR